MTAFHSTDNEILEVVDHQDRVIGTATRREIHEKGLFHRAVHVFVFNHGGEIFIQRRSSAKDRHPLKLDSSAAGHVDPEESYQAAARRELAEELGIDVPVNEVLWLRAQEGTDQEHVALFTAFTDRAPLPNEAEIVWGAFMKPESVTELMEANHSDFVPAFRLLWKMFKARET